MTKRTRTILFLIFLFLFCLITPAAVFYSQGYRLDLSPPAGGIKLTQTGGFFLKAEPKQVEIYIDGKLAKRTDFFFGSALIENLLPKKYKIRVEKEGFHPWQKELEIKEKGVTDVKNLILFPKNPSFNVLAKGSENFWFSPDEKKIILMENPPAGGEEGWALKLYDPEKNIKSHLVLESDVDADGADLMNLKFSEDSKEIYLDIGIKEEKKHFVLKLDSLPPQLSEREILPPPENTIASQKINNDFYYLDNSGYVFKNEAKLNEEPFSVQVETEYGLKIFQNFVFLSEGKTLYLFDSDSKSFEKFFDGINVLKVSPDNKKMVFSSDFEIWLFFLSALPGKKAGEKLFLVRLSEKIGDVFWINSDYLIFNSGNNLKIVEIDDRDRIQAWDVATFPGPEIYFNGSNRKLYVLSQESLFVSEKLF